MSSYFNQTDLELLRKIKGIKVRPAPQFPPTLGKKNITQELKN